MKRLVILFAFFLYSFVSSAQPGDPGGGKDPFDTPITGIEWLVIAGGFFGARKVYHRFRNKS